MSKQQKKLIGFLTKIEAEKLIDHRIIDHLYSITPVKLCLGLQIILISLTIINLFKLQDSTYNMRDNNKFKIPLINTNAKKCNIIYYGPICWNNLQIHIKSYNSQT